MGPLNKEILCQEIKKGNTKDQKSQKFCENLKYQSDKKTLDKTNFSPEGEWNESIIRLGQTNTAIIIFLSKRIQSYKNN